MKKLAKFFCFLSAITCCVACQPLSQNSTNSSVSVQESSSVKKQSRFYNPDGYYDKEEELDVKIVGNSFVSPSFSNTANWLQRIADANDATLIVDVLSIGNGRIPNQIEAAFGEIGYMHQLRKPDVLFVQDFYDWNDYQIFESFLTTLLEVAPQTEAKVYPGENETDDGIYAAEDYVIDLVDWKGLIVELKYTYRFGSSNLNASDGWHPNTLSGFAGAILLYADLYGEMPSQQSLNVFLEELYPYLPGDSQEAKIQKGNQLISAAEKIIFPQ